MATPAASHGRASLALDLQSPQCELNLYSILPSPKLSMLTYFLLLGSISKLLSLGLSGTLAYNMNTMDSLVEL